MKESAIDMDLQDGRTTGVIHEESCLCSGLTFAGSYASNAGDWFDVHRTSSHGPIQGRLHEAMGKR
jgi:hypothetical protein